MNDAYHQKRALTLSQNLLERLVAALELMIKANALWEKGEIGESDKVKVALLQNYPHTPCARRINRGKHQRPTKRIVHPRSRVANPPEESLEDGLAALKKYPPPAWGMKRLKTLDHNNRKGIALTTKEIAWLQTIEVWFWAFDITTSNTRKYDEKEDEEVFGER